MAFCTAYVVPCKSRSPLDIPARLATWRPAHVTSPSLQSDIHAEEGSNTRIPNSLTGSFVIQLKQDAIFAASLVTTTPQDGAQHLASYVHNSNSAAALTGSTVKVPHWSS